MADQSLWTNRTGNYQRNKYHQFTSSIPNNIIGTITAVNGTTQRTYNTDWVYTYFYNDKTYIAILSKTTRNINESGHIVYYTHWYLEVYDGEATNAIDENNHGIPLFEIDCGEYDEVYHPWWEVPAFRVTSGYQGTLNTYFTNSEHRPEIFFLNNKLHLVTIVSLQIDSCLSKKTVTTDLTPGVITTDLYNYPRTAYYLLQVKHITSDMDGTIESSEVYKFLPTSPFEMYTKTVYENLIDGTWTYNYQIETYEDFDSLITNGENIYFDWTGASYPSVLPKTGGYVVATTGQSCLENNGKLYFRGTITGSNPVIPSEHTTTTYSSETTRRVTTDRYPITLVNSKHYVNEAVFFCYDLESKSLVTNDILPSNRPTDGCVYGHVATTLGFTNDTDGGIYTFIGREYKATLSFSPSYTYYSGTGGLCKIDPLTLEISWVNTLLENSTRGDIVSILNEEKEATPIIYSSGASPASTYMYSFTSNGATKLFNTGKEWNFDGPYAIIPVNDANHFTNVLVRGLGTPNRIEMIQDTYTDPNYNKTYTGMSDYDLQAVDQDTIFTEHAALSYTCNEIFTYTNSAHFLALGKKYLYVLYTEAVTNHIKIIIYGAPPHTGNFWVESTDPEDNDINVPVNYPIKIEFNLDPNVDTITSESLTIKIGDVEYEYYLVYPGSGVYIYLKTIENFLPSSHIDVSLTADIKSEAAGYDLEAYAFDFNTAADGPSGETPPDAPGVPNTAAGLTSPNGPEQGANKYRKIQRSSYGELDEREYTE